VRLKGFNFVPFRLKQAYFFSFIQFVIFFIQLLFSRASVSLYQFESELLDQQCKVFLYTELNTRWDSVNIILFMTIELEMP